MKTDLITEDLMEQSIHQQEIQTDEQKSGLKKCRFCAEWIQAEAIKCRYCGEFLDGSGGQGAKPRNKKWYYNTSSVVIALLCIGPLALPLVWFNPRYKPVIKVVVTVIVIIFTFILIYLMGYAYQQFLSQLTERGL